MYSYNTPEEAIKSLEKAYTNNDLDAIINSKDFICEAKFILEDTTFSLEVENRQLIEETAELLKLTLIQSLLKNGYPDFTDLKSEIYGLQGFRDNIYVVNEKVKYPDNSVFVTRIFLSYNDGIWKVALIEE
jgi:hypothetical protein